MFKKIFFLIIFSSLTLNSYSFICDPVNKKNVKEVNYEWYLSNKLDNFLAKTYTQNPWLFMEDIFINTRKELIFKSENIFKILCTSCISFGIIEFISSGLFYESIKNSYEQDKYILNMVFKTIANLTALGINIRYIAHRINKIDREILFEFLDNYYLAEKTLYIYNYRDYTPKKLIPFFDDLKNDYEINGRHYINHYGKSITNAIINEIKMHKNQE